MKEEEQFIEISYGLRDLGFHVAPGGFQNSDLNRLNLGSQWYGGLGWNVLDVDSFRRSSVTVWAGGFPGVEPPTTWLPECLSAWEWIKIIGDSRMGYHYVE